MTKESKLQVTKEYWLKMVLDDDNTVSITAHGPDNWSCQVDPLIWQGVGYWKFKYVQKGILKGTKVIVKRIKIMEELEESSNILTALTEFI